MSCPMVDLYNHVRPASRNHFISNIDRVILWLLNLGPGKMPPACDVTESEPKHSLPN